MVAMSLTLTQRHMVMAHFESTATLKTVGNLQNIAIRLPAAYGVGGNGTFTLVEEGDGYGNKEE